MPVTTQIGKWECLGSGVIHAGIFMEVETLCGITIPRVEKKSWRAVDYDRKIDCLNCERALRSHPNRYELEFGRKPPKKAELEKLFGPLVTPDQFSPAEKRIRAEARAARTKAAFKS